MLALWVIVHHLSGSGQMLESAARGLPPALFTIIRSGYLAVTTFFVLSGFVLSRSYSATVWSPRSILRYSAARLARVYPVYLCSLLVLAPFILADRTPGKAGFLAVHGLLLQGWLGHIAVQWNTPAWSLSCEMFFYLSFPLAAAWMHNAGWRKTLCAAVVACGLTRVLWAAGVNDGIKPLIHLADFLMGIAASCTYDLLRSARRRPAGAWLYLPGLAAAAAIIAWPALLPAGVDLNSALRPLNGVMLIGLALGGGAIARALSTTLAVFLGKASYAMYILHVPLLWWYLRWTGQSAAVYMTGVIGISAAVYRWIEEPANRYLRSRIQVALQP